MTAQRLSEPCAGPGAGAGAGAATAGVPRSADAVSSGVRAAAAAGAGAVSAVRQVKPSFESARTVNLYILLSLAMV